MSLSNQIHIIKGIYNGLNYAARRRAQAELGYSFKEVFEVSYLKKLCRALTIVTLALGMWFFVGHPVYAGNVVLTGHDDFANVDVRVGKVALTTQLYNDPLLPSGGGVVVE